jgi:hypothetical protein
MAMSEIATFDVRVAARTRAADQILRNKELLELYEEHGGLKDDLVEIRELGRRAEALSQARSGAKSAGGAAVQTALESFAELQRDYSAVMAVVQAVRRDLEKHGAEAGVIAAIEKILIDETAVLIRVEGAEGDKKRRAMHSRSQEAVRAEIYKDASALLELKAAHAALGKRKLTPARLKKLRDDAAALAEQLGDKATKKGAGKAATEAVREVVREQKQVWAACYRILAFVGQQDQRVRQLLAEASRKR